MSKSFSPSVGQPVRRAAMAAILVAAVAGCADSKPAGTIGYVKGFGGLVTADEPRAVLAARDVLSAGGTAADAAVTLYFTLAVTQPSIATLGGGGVCVVSAKDKKRVEVMEFLAPPSTQSGSVATPSAVPANVRGFYALHARYGKFRWENLIAEPERLARNGSPVSRAFAGDVARAAPLLANDPQLRAIFLPDGRPLVEGQLLEQRDLAATLGRIRRSPGELYSGPVARDLVASVTRAGGSLTAEDLRDVKPLVREALTVQLGSDTAYFAPPPSVAGGLAAEMTAALAERYAKAAPDERQHLLVEAAGQAFVDRSRWMMPHGWPNDQMGNLVGPERANALLASYNSERHAPVQGAKPTDAIPAAGFAVLDSMGNSVACNVTPYGLFGNGRMAPGTGIVLAAVPGLSSGPPAIGPVMVVNPNTHEMRFAAAASGGVTAPTAMVQTLFATLYDNKPLEQAVAAGRVHHSGLPDMTFVEAEREVDMAPLSRRGHDVKTTPMPSRVNALHCASGEPSIGKCRAVSDPRGSGLSVTVGRD